MNRTGTGSDFKVKVIVTPAAAPAVLAPGSEGNKVGIEAGVVAEATAEAMRSGLAAEVSVMVTVAPVPKRGTPIAMGAVVTANAVGAPLMAKLKISVPQKDRCGTQGLGIGQ